MDGVGIIAMYQKEANEYISSSDCPEYLRKAERRLTESKGYLREVKPQEKSEAGDTLNSLLKAVHELQKEMNFMKVKIDKQGCDRPNPKVVTCHFCKKRGQHTYESCVHNCTILLCS